MCLVQYGELATQLLLAAKVSSYFFLVKILSIMDGEVGMVLGKNSEK